MKANILYFPARSCSYFVHYRCIKNYLWHPVAHTFTQCRVLTIWEDVQDQVLGSAKDLSLTVEESLRFFVDSVSPYLEPEWLCTRYHPAGTDTGVDCIFLHGHLCRQTLPPCPGVCVNYRNASSVLTEGLEHV